ncbi:ankyrin repeat domain-containing protein SOWAHC [Carcharodon carcharias]|uniref:ankyrin repeat domain-containing protein SOWAHC n=1 Tax=Carcharodon carcharias TaxID=13397 RepID=UPI001B7E375A|nr:ankyrin repeat domain-containing protein SOWAHC [Carcharodon carcharias]
MFEKLGEMSHSRLLAATSPGASYHPAGDTPTVPDCAGSLCPPKDCNLLTYGSVLENVNRLSHLLGRFLETAENSERRNGFKGASSAADRPPAGAGTPGGTFPSRSREAEVHLAPSRSLRKREGFRRDSGVSAAEPAQGASPGARKRCLKELMRRNGWDGFSGMWSAGSSRKSGEREQEVGDRGSLSSSDTDQSAGSPGLALEPREHEWMLAVAAGDWETMEALLLQEPSLLNKKDFVSGLTATHWLAKQGKDEALMKLVRLAESRRWPLDLNAKAGGGGYTALHLAAMQGHLMVIKLLVGAYSADVDIRDYRGRKAWQYLGSQAPSQLRQLAGAQEDSEPQPPKQAPLPAAEDEVDSPDKKLDFSIIASIHRFFKPTAWLRTKREADNR